MDREKLNEAAERYEEDSTYGGMEALYDTKFAFKQGALWHESLPLSERLTDEEKEKIRGYLTSAMFVYTSGSHASLEGLRDMFIDIFGADLFK